MANPFGILSLPAWWYSFFRTVAVVSFTSLILARIASLFVRFRRSVGDERQQMKWLAYFLLTAIGAQILIFEIPGALFYPQNLQSVWYNLILWIVFLGIPMVIGIAIFKYRLYAIDLIIHRTLVYGGLTIIVVAFMY